MITTAIEIFSYMYIFLNMIHNFNQYHLISFLSMTNYFLFDTKTSMYILCLNLLCINYKYIPVVTQFFYHKVQDTKYIKQIEEISRIYKFKTVDNIIITIGDVVTKVFESIIYYFISKVHTKTDAIPPVSISEVTEKIDDFLETDEESFKKINDELDNLLSIGTNIITQTMAGKKDEQKENVNSFMNKFTLLFGKKDN